MKILPAFLSVFLLVSCTKDDDNLVKTINQPVTSAVSNSIPQQKYLALGDSYTIGESVSQKESFPYQLINKINKKNKNFSPPTIIARTGWTSSELQQAIKAAKLTQKYDFVSLLIGVNNQFQRLSKDRFRLQFRDLLATAIKFANGKTKHVSVISIPDWGATPYGKKSGRSQKEISLDIDKYNAIVKAETQAQGASWTNITPFSRKVATDPTLVASDGLHPSGKMYAGWVDAIIATFNKDN
jgi:lysophospholipase L1-like esterase